MKVVMLCKRISKVGHSLSRPVWNEFVGNITGGVLLCRNVNAGGKSRNVLLFFVVLTIFNLVWYAHAYNKGMRPLLTGAPNLGASGY